MAQAKVSTNEKYERRTIKRQMMEDRSKPISYEVPKSTYEGPKKPPMPAFVALNNVPPLVFLVSKVMEQERANEYDFAFLQDIQHSPCPEYNGYNTRLLREEEKNHPKAAADVTYLPLIDNPPADHDTIKTAIDKGLSLIKGTNEDVLIFTVDQQLYKVAIDVMFHEPIYFASVVPVLGGMHMLMNFIHAVSVIMGGSGLKEVLAETFGSIDKMLSGKKYPQNIQ